MNHHHGISLVYVTLIGDDIEPATVEAIIVQIADTISSSRPGARRETLESHIKRLQQLEKIGDSFQGVEKSYAIQAGREIRVIVQPTNVNESEAVFLARDIARRIEEELTYPGEIKVTVIRETRSEEVAQ